MILMNFVIVVAVLDSFSPAERDIAELQVCAINEQIFIVSCLE